MADRYGTGGEDAGAIAARFNAVQAARARLTEATAGATVSETAFADALLASDAAASRAISRSDEAAAARRRLGVTNREVEASERRLTAAANESAAAQERAARASRSGYVGSPGSWRTAPPAPPWTGSPGSWRRGTATDPYALPFWMQRNQAIERQPLPPSRQLGPGPADYTAPRPAGGAGLADPRFITAQTGALDARTAAARRAAVGMSALTTAEARQGAMSAEWIMSMVRGEATLRSVGSQIGVTAAKFGGWVLAGAAVYGVFDAVRALGHGAAESNNAVAQLSRFIETGFDTDKAKAQLRDLASSTNTSISEAGEAAAQFARVFHNQDQAMAAAHAALILHQLDNLSLADSYRALTAVIQGFHLQASAIPGLMDSINASQREFGANVSQIVAGFGRAAGSVNVQGGTPQHLQAMLATIIRSTGGQGANIGIAIGRAATRFSQQPANQEILKHYGIETNKGWDQLIDSAIEQIQRRNLRGNDIRKISQAVGGPAFGARYFAAFFQNADLYKNILTDTSPERAKGSAQEELDKRLSSLGQQFHRVRVEAENLGSELEQSGGGVPFQVLATALQGVLLGVRGVISGFRELPGVLQAGVAGAVALYAVVRGIQAFTRTGGLTSRIPVIGGLAGGATARQMRGVLRGAAEAETGNVVSAASAQRVAARELDVAQRTGQTEEIRLAEQRLATAEQRLAIALDIRAEAEALATEYARATTNAERAAVLERYGVAGVPGTPGGPPVGGSARGPGGGVPVFGPPLASERIPDEEAPRTVNEQRQLREETGRVRGALRSMRESAESAGSRLRNIAGGGAGGGGVLGGLGAVAFAATIGVTLGELIKGYFDDQGAKAQARGVGPQTAAQAHALYARGQREFNKPEGGFFDRLFGTIDQNSQDYYTSNKGLARGINMEWAARERALGVRPITYPRVAPPVHATPKQLDDILRAAGIGPPPAPIHERPYDPKSDPLPAEQYTGDIVKRDRDLVNAVKRHHGTADGVSKVLEASLGDIKNALDYKGDKDPKKRMAALASAAAQVTTMMADLASDHGGRGLRAALEAMDPKTFATRMRGDADVFAALGHGRRQIHEAATGYSLALRDLRKNPSDPNALQKFNAAREAVQQEQQAMTQIFGDAFQGASGQGGRTGAIDTLFRQVNQLPAGRIRRQGLAQAQDTAGQAIIQRFTDMAASAQSGAQFDRAVDQALAQARHIKPGPHRAAVMAQIYQTQAQAIAQRLGDDFTLAMTPGQEDAAFARAQRDAAKIPGRQGRLARQQNFNTNYNRIVGELSTTLAIQQHSTSNNVQADTLQIQYLDKEIAAAKRNHQSSMVIAGLTQQKLAAVEQQAQDAIALADSYAQLRVAGTPSYDPVQNARNQAFLARTHLHDVLANRAGLGKNFQTAYNDALAGVKNSNQSVNEAIAQQAADTEQARYQYLESLTTNPIKIDRYKIKADTAAIGAAHTQAERYRAEAQRNQDKNQLIADRVSQREDDIQFALDMHKITNYQAEQELQGLLKIHGLTKAERRDIQRRIQSLKDAATSEASGFDLDVGSIKAPTMYDVRRAMHAAVHGSPGPATPHAIVHQSNRVSVVVEDPKAAHKVWAAMDDAINGGVAAAMRSAGVA